MNCIFKYTNIINCKYKILYKIKFANYLTILRKKLFTNGKKDSMITNHKKHRAVFEKYYQMIGQ